MKPEEQFYEIAQRTIERANRVDCSAQDYRAGLLCIIEEVQIALQASKESELGNDREV